MSQTKHVGYGRFPVGEFPPGAAFASDDGTIGVVCEQQGSDQRYIEVWIDHAKTRARKTWMPRATLVHAISSEQALCIERHQRRAKRRRTVKDTTYNGWTNFETWAVHLWLGNEESTYRYWRAAAEECRKEAPTASQVVDGIWSEAEAAKFLLADRLKEELTAASPLQDRPSLYSDLLDAALSEVSYHEVAEAFLEE